MELIKLKIKNLFEIRTFKIIVAGKLRKEIIDTLLTADQVIDHL